MDHATKDLLEELKERGYRITNPRKAIIEAFVTATSPHTIPEFVAHVAVDEATVYRTIDLLLEENLIEAINVQGDETRFALAHGHHHHLVCTNCGYIEHLPCSTPDLGAVEHTFASIRDHEVTFYGLCKTCAQ